MKNLCVKKGFTQTIIIITTLVKKKNSYNFAGDT